MKVGHVLLALLLALLILGLFVGRNDSIQKPKSLVKPNPSKLRAFLESQYVPEAGLLRAAFKACPDKETIYIANDNLLASRALVALKSPLGERIEANLDENYSSGWNGKVDVLLGRPIHGFYCTD